MVNIANWKFEDLGRFVGENVQEDSHLDFKESGAISVWDKNQRDEITKDVSAFANADGGILIYGVVEGKSRADEPVSKFEKFDVGIPTSITRESIENVLTSERFIHKKIDGLKIKTIEVPNSEGKRFYLVIDIPRSYRAPHMHNPSKRYYKRHNFKAEPMEGYEVEDIRNRTVTPQVQITFPFKMRGMEDQGAIHYYAAQFFLENVGTRSLKDFYFELHIPAVIAPDCGGALLQRPQSEIDDYETDDLDYKIFHSKPQKEILFPGQKLLLCELTYKVDDSIYSVITDYNPKFYWRIYKDDSPPDFGEEYIREIEEF